MQTFIAIWLLLVAAPLSAQSFADEIEGLVQPHAEAGLFSGVILVANSDEVIFQKGYGFANWEQRVANNATTRLGVGSITKSMTVNVADALIEEGRIRLDDPVEEYIPDFPRGPAGGMATIEHLLHHRAGVPHRVTSAAEESQPMSTSDIVAKVAGLGLLFEPGSERLYSSAGYTTLARVLEVAGNQPFSQLIADYVFVPAGMSSARSETGQDLMAWRALPYRLGADANGMVVKHAPYKDLRFLTGAGSIYATASDLHRYVRAIDNGVFGDEARADLFGDDLTAWRGIYGRTNGYEASVDVFAGEQVLIVLLSNLQSATTGQVRARLQALVAGGEVVEIPLPPDVGDAFEDPADIVGVYGRAEIHIVSGALFRGDNEFYPTDGGYYIPGSGTRMTFRRNSAGLVDALISTSASGRESVLEKTAR